MLNDNLLALFAPYFVELTNNLTSYIHEFDIIFIQNHIKVNKQTFKLNK